MSFFFSFFSSLLVLSCFMLLLQSYSLPTTCACHMHMHHFLLAITLPTCALCAYLALPCYLCHYATSLSLSPTYFVTFPTCFTTSLSLSPTYFVTFPTCFTTSLPLSPTYVNHLSYSLADTTYLPLPPTYFITYLLSRHCFSLATYCLFVLLFAYFVLMFVLNLPSPSINVLALTQSYALALCVNVGA
jgi:hypothetical protein